MTQHTSDAKAKRLVTRVGGAFAVLSIAVLAISSFLFLLHDWSTREHLEDPSWKGFLSAHWKLLLGDIDIWSHDVSVDDRLIVTGVYTHLMRASIWALFMIVASVGILVRMSWSRQMFRWTVAASVAVLAIQLAGAVNSTFRQSLYRVQVLHESIGAGDIVSLLVVIALYAAFIALYVWLFRRFSSEDVVRYFSGGNTH